MINKRGLIIPFKALIDECEALLAYAGHFLDKNTTDVLREAKNALENLRVSRCTRPLRWGIPMDRPLCTKWSDGESQPNGRSKHKIRAQFSFVWEIRRLDEGKYNNGQYLLLDGLASTITTIVEQTDGGERCIARWAMDVGDYHSPGIHFHFQVKGQDDTFFPESLDIPRLPAPLMSPFLAVDLALGELFQDRWSQYATADNKATRTWRNIHQDRLLRFLEWQSKCVSSCIGSPWMAMKRAKPQRDLLVADR